MRRYWITYFTSVLLLAPLLGWLIAVLDLEMQYIGVSLILCYIALGIVTVYSYCQIANMSIGRATLCTIVYATPGIGLIMLVNATIFAEDIAPNLFWAVTESMFAIGISNALGMLMSIRADKSDSRR